MKENFQGPTQYNINHPGSNQPQYSPQANSTAWQQQGHQAQQSRSKYDKIGPYEKSFEDRNYAPDRTRDPKNIQPRPDTSKQFEKVRGFSPTGRGDDSMQRRLSPTRGKDGPEHRVLLDRVGDIPKRRLSPTGRSDAISQRRLSPSRMGDAIPRRVSPQGRRGDPHGRRYSPVGKRISPAGDRRNLPGVRLESPPPRRISPNRRLVSPVRRDDQRSSRFSPSRHHADKIGDKYEQDSKDHKIVRPAYDTVSSHAQNQAMYSGGYRSNIPDSVRFPVSELRQEQQAPWQRHRDEATLKKQDHVRTDERMPLARGRIIEKVDRRYSPTRQSRSPTRRDRSLIRDRYKRNSRSPRSSHSPRRSWALEKRRSPDAPPPPLWPGQSEDNPRSRPTFPEKENNQGHQPVWEGRPFKEEELRSRRNEERRQYDEAKIRIAKDLERNPQVPTQEHRYHNEPKLAPRGEYDERHDNYGRRDSPDRKILKDDVPRRLREEEHHDDYNRRRESPYRDIRKVVHTKNLDKDIEDIYNRALQFKKKTEELRKSASKKSDEFEDIHKQTQKDRDLLRYEDRMRYREIESQRIRERENEDKLRDERTLREDRTLRDDRTPRDVRGLRDDRVSRDDRIIRDDRILRAEKTLRDERSPRDDRALGDLRALRDDRALLESRTPHDDRVLRDDRGPRDDRPIRDGGRDDRLREDRIREDRSHYPEGRHSDFHRREEQERKKSTDDIKSKRIFFTDISVKHKRDKAVNEIAEKIIERNEDYKHVQGEQRQRILEELKLAVARIVYDMFGESDVSFIEVIIKYQARYNLKDEAKLLQDVIQSLPKPLRILKRHAKDSSEHATKISRHSPSADLKPEPQMRPKLSDSSFNVKLAPPNVVTVPCFGVPQSQSVVNQTMFPMLVSAPFYQAYDSSLQQNLQNALYVPEPVPPVIEMSQPVAEVVSYSEANHQLNICEDDGQDGYRLYLCKDDFDRITNMEADCLKDFIICQLLETTEQSQGWAPEFTIKGLQTLHRYEVVTKDEGSKNWFLGLDFSEFSYFRVLIYTKEELWYERAAIWLPGHSRLRNIEPLEKLRLQNKKLVNVNLDKWKFVKKIVNTKGTRLYIDMPPSSARALEAHDMKLSYELQQVSVFLKAVAVDKDAFDAGLKEVSVTCTAEIIEAIQNAPMPSLSNDCSLVKIVLKGSKTLDLTQARKIKEVVIYHLFKYHQQNGLNRTDFLKYGFLQPNYFAIMPLNQESKQWLMGCSFGKVNRQAIVVVGGEEDNTRFIKMVASIPCTKLSNLREQYVMERLKHSNPGIKGVNFSKWKPIAIRPGDKRRARFEVQIDMESVVTLSTMRYQLDYKDSNGLHALYFSSDYSQSGLVELIKKYKTEMTDTYDVSNMDLDSNQSDDELSDEVVCLD